MSLLDIEHLQKLTFERSKNWANLIENISNKETLDDFNLNELDNVYEFDEDDKGGDLSSMEDDDDTTVDSEILRNVSNTTRLSLLLNNKAKVPDSSSAERNQLIDIFNQTLPIINEHNRQLKEFGLDKILISFDKKRIEEEVGGWLNRHNSLYGGYNTSLLDVAKNEDRQLMPNARHTTVKNNTNKSSSRKEVVIDSDDSLQSGETARYIRSSRIGAIKKSTSPPTMIKTFRTVKSTRETLREKYSFKMDDEDYHLKTIHHNRKISSRQNHYDLTQFHKSHKCDMTPLSSLKQRRKVYRKRASSNSCSTMDSSSDSDNCHQDYGRSHRKLLKHCCRHLRSAAKYRNHTQEIAANTDIKAKKTCSAMKMPYGRMDRMYYYTHQSFSTSSSSCSFSGLCEMRRKIKRNAKDCKDNRPRKRESECQCCNEKKLCSKFKHVADTSTEEWYVENGCSPKKPSKIPATEIKNKTKAKSNKLQSKNKSSLEPKSKTILKDESTDENVENRCPPKKLSKTPNTKSYMANFATKALPSVTETLHADLKSKNKSKTKSSKLQYIIENSSTSSEDELKIAIKLSKESYKKEQMAALKKEIQVSNPYQTTLKNLENKKTEDTFLTTTKTICNSTALSSKSNAYKRQIVDQLIPQEDKAGLPQNIREVDMTKSVGKETKNSKIKKSTKKKVTEHEKQIQKVAASNTVTSTTVRSPELRFNSTSEQFQENEFEHSDDHSGCALVTSTTNIEMPFVRSINKTIENVQQQNNSTKNSNNNQLSQNHILIYTPDNRNMAQANSFTSDGCYFTITKEHLRHVIGEKEAEKFLRYYIGCKRFRSDSVVYYIPPTTTTLSDNNQSSSSDSVDDLDNLGQYGDLYAIIKQQEPF